MNRRYKSTESKYKGGAKEMYITYDLDQETRAGGSATYPKVKRVYIAGDVKDWNTGKVKKRSGRTVHGVEIEYQQTRTSYNRKGFTAKRDKAAYKVRPASVKGSSQEFRKVIEIPEGARNVHLYTTPAKLPKKYQSALQDVR